MIRVAMWAFICISRDSRCFAGLAGPLCALLSAFASWASTASAAEDLRTYVVKVYGASTPGSGVVIRSGTLGSTILTAGHVVKDTSIADSPYVASDSGQQYPITHISISSTLDLAEITVMGSLHPAPVYPGNHDGGDILLVGFPQASTKSLILKGSSQPQSRSSRIRPGGYGIIHSAKSSIGFSGGGVFNKYGQLIGIHGQADTSALSSGRIVKTGLALAIPVSFWLEGDLPNENKTEDARNADLFAQVSYLRSSMKHEHAIKKVAKAILAAPRDGHLRLLRASLYLDLKKPSLALDDLAVAEQSMPTSSAVNANKGIAYFLEGDYEASLRSYDEAIKLDSGIVDIYINKSKALLRLGRPLDALEALNTAISKNKQSANALIERAHLNYDLGRLSEAESDINRYIDAYPDDAVALSLMGAIYGKAGGHEKSYRSFARAAEISPNNATFALNEAVAIAKLGDYPSSIKKLEEILSRDAGFAAAWANIAEVLFLSGDSDKSCEAARKASELNYIWIESEWNSSFLKTCVSAN